jgi:3-hydroxyisobutyrate dehydrogenase
MTASPAGASAGDNADTYGFIGLGLVGSIIAGHEIAAGADLLVHDVREDVTERYRADGVRVAGSLAELGAAATVVSVCVLNDNDLRSVVYGPDGLLHTMRPGGLIVIHSTCAPATCVDIAASARERGLSVLDAPVSNGRKDSGDLRWVVLAGGRDADVARCAPLFGAFAAEVLPTGEVGSAQLVKLINNALYAVHWNAAAETFRTVAALGLDKDQVRRALLECSAGTPMPETISRAALAKLLTKDATLLEDTLRGRDIDEAGLSRAARRAVSQIARGAAPAPSPEPLGALPTVIAAPVASAAG